MKLEDFTEFESSFASSCFQAMTSIQGKLERMQNDDGNIDEQNYVMGLSGCMGKAIEPNVFLSGGELKKQISSSNKAVQDLIARLNRESDYNLPNVTVKPDYVIHYSVKRENLSSETQKLVIEAKTTNKLAQDPFSWDLYKLMAYVNELSFQTAVFLILNTDKSRVETLLAGYKEQELPVINVPRGHLLFFIQDTIKSIPKAYYLDCTED